jgi:protein-S-isoprenylcysteine O-methyltransferase Ste14
MKKIGEFFFKYRSYTPLPLIFVMILFINPTIISFIAGLFVAFSGELIRIWSVGYAGSETRTTESAGGSNLVTQGPYSKLRNPLYLGNIMIYAGIGIMSNSLFPYLQIFALIYFYFQYYTIIITEEDYLASTFKNSYDLYKKCVNKFIPLFSKVPIEIKSQLEFSLKEGLQSEKRSLQAFIITTTIILFFLISGIRIIKIY